MNLNSSTSRYFAEDLAFFRDAVAAGVHVHYVHLVKIARIAPYLAPVAAGALVAVAAVVHVSWWQERYVTPFDAAVEDARDAADASAQAFASLGEARVAAGPVVTDARAVVEKGAGFLGAAALDDLTNAIPALEAALDTSLPVVDGKPQLGRPDVTEIADATAELLEWSDGELARAEAVLALSDDVVSATTTVADALSAVGGTAAGSASAELAAAPLATADARAAVEAARDAVSAAVTAHTELADAVARYAGAVTALRSSQQQAQAAADAEAASDRERAQRMAEMRRRMFEALGIDPDTCQQIAENTWACP